MFLCYYNFYKLIMIFHTRNSDVAYIKVVLMFKHKQPIYGTTRDIRKKSFRSVFENK